MDKYIDVQYNQWEQEAQERIQQREREGFIFVAVFVALLFLGVMFGGIFQVLVAVIAIGIFTIIPILAGITGKEHG